MAYVPYDWRTGEKITEVRLDHMEQGIADASDEVTELKADLSKSVEIVSTNLFSKKSSELTRGTYLNDNGVTVTIENTNFMTTGYVDIGDYVRIKCIGKGTGPYSIHFYDAQNVHIDRISTQGDTNYELIINVPSGAKYVKLSSFIVEPSVMYEIPVGELSTDIFTDTRDYVYIKNGVVYDEYKADTTFNITGGYITANGELNTDAPISRLCYYSDYVPIETNNILFSGNNTVSVIGVHYYDINHSYIGHEITETANKVPLNVPNNASYLRMTSYNQPFTLWLPVTVKDKIETLDNANNLYNKNVCVIGDSITEYNFRAKKNWSMLMQEKTLCVVQNLGVSGTGFARLNPYINRISNINTDTDIIGVACSFNDLDAGIPLGSTADTGTETVCGYINDFFTALISALPTKPIICYCQNPWANARYGVSVSDNYVNAVKTICEKNNIPFYGDMYFKGSALRPWIQANCEEYFTSDNGDIGNTGIVDTVHPNSKGHIIIEQHLVNYFNENVV